MMRTSWYRERLRVVIIPMFFFEHHARKISMPPLLHSSLL